MANSNFLTFDGLIFYDTKLKAWIQANGYSLPKASETVLGGIKIGTGLSIDADGKLSVEGIELSWNAITGKPTFAAVATSGNYTDLNNTPTIPTLLSQLTNDSNYQSASEVAAAISASKLVTFEKVASLPEVGSAKPNTIYLIPRAGEEEDNILEEWFVVDGKWELLGTTLIDLSNYWSKDELVPVTNAQIDTLFA